MRISWKIKKHHFCKLLQVMLFGIIIIASASIKSYAAPKQMADGNIFDAEFYANTYPDVVAVLGNNETVLYNHYMVSGNLEGRLPYAPGAAMPATSPSIEESVITKPNLSFNASDFKILGYPLNENHYKEWKTAFGYNLNDNEMYNMMECKIYEGRIMFYSPSLDYCEFRLGSSSYDHVNWKEQVLKFNNGNAYARSFTIGRHDQASKIGQLYEYKISTIYEGPLTTGMTLDEVLRVLGVTQTVSSSNYNGSEFWTYTISDGVYIELRKEVDLFKNIKHLIFVDNTNLTVIECKFIDDITDSLTVHFAILP